MDNPPQQLPPQQSSSTNVQKWITWGILIAVLILAIIIGGSYYLNSRSSGGKACTMEAKQCSDGSYVGRVPPSCDFAPCPASSPTPDAEGQFCGGIAGTSCPVGFTCQLDGNYPDAGGKCRKEQ